MKLKGLGLIGLLYLGSHCFAQTLKVELTVTNDKKEALQNVSADLFLLHDTILQTKKVLQAGSYFTFKKGKKYFVKLSSTAMYDTAIVLKGISSDTNIVVAMRPKASDLADVTVVARKPLVKDEDDKTIVDAEVLANSSTNAYEILEKTPGVIVDQDGNVYLNGTNAATVFINGREMKLSTADLASLLKSLPAGSVSKIEILRTPSAKYDAASSGGIVNIVLKKGVKLGTNGSVNAAYFQGVYATETAGFNLNKGSGKINSYLNYQYTNRNNFETLNSGRFIKVDSTLLSQRSYTTYPTTVNYLGAGIDVQFTEKFSAGFDLRFSNSNGNSYAENGIDIRKSSSPAILGKNLSDIINSNNSSFLSNGISAKYKIDTTGSEWTASVNYDFYKNNNTQLYENYSYLPAKPTVIGNGNNNNDKNIFVFQTDLTLKLPAKLTLELGVKANLSSSKNSAEYVKDTGNNVSFVDIYQTNTFKYNEKIFAAYVQLSKTFWGFTFKPGIRLETTDISGRQTIPNDTSLFLKRTDIFPFVYLKHKLFNLFGFPLIANAIFRKSIKRPYYEILNPYPKYIDQYLFDVGNPVLKPQFTTNYELNVSFDNIPVVAVGINDTKDIFTNVTYQDNSTRIAYRTYDNLGRNKEFYAKLIGGIPPGGKYFFYAGALYNYAKYTGLYEGLPLNYSRGSWTFFMFHEFKITKTFSANMQGFLKTKGLQNLYELNTFGGVFISANKSILKKKANIIISVNDLLRTNQVTFSLKQGSVNAIGERINDTRKLGITFRYNFGIKPKTDKKKGFDVPADIN